MEVYKKDLNVKCCTNASFTTHRDDCKSQLGYAFVINYGVISKKSSKKSVVAQSITESEYILLQKLQRMLLG